MDRKSLRTEDVIVVRASAVDPMAGKNDMVKAMFKCWEDETRAVVSFLEGTVQMIVRSEDILAKFFEDLQPGFTSTQAASGSQVTPVPQAAIDLHQEMPDPQVMPGASASASTWTPFEGHYTLTQGAWDVPDGDPSLNYWDLSGWHLPLADLQPISWAKLERLKPGDAVGVLCHSLKRVPAPFKHCVAYATFVSMGTTNAFVNLCIPATGLSSTLVSVQDVLPDPNRWDLRVYNLKPDDLRAPSTQEYENLHKYEGRFIGMTHTDEEGRVTALKIRYLGRSDYPPYVRVQLGGIDMIINDGLLISPSQLAL